MSHGLKLIVMSLVASLTLVGLLNPVNAATYTWSGPLDGTADWNDDLNWGGGGVGAYPKDQDDVAILTVANIGELTVNLNEAITIGALTTGNTADTSQTFLAPNGGSLTFDVSSGNASWTHSPTGGASFDITAPVFLDDSIEIYNDLGNYEGRQLINGSVSASSSGLKTILWKGFSNPDARGKPYFRVKGAVSDGVGQLGVTIQSNAPGSAPGMYLDNNGNTFTGEVLDISPGGSDLIVSTPNSLGSTSAGTTITGDSGHAVLYLRGSIHNEDLTISGTGGPGGVLWSDKNDVIWGGTITMVGDTRIGANSGGAALTLDSPGGNAIEGDFNLIINASGPVSVNDPISIGSGGLTKQGGDTLILDTVSVYTGDTTITGGTLATTEAYLDDSSSVSISAGAWMALNFAGSDVIAGLTLGDVIQAPGIYNSVSNPEYFTGGGSLHVVFEPTARSWRDGLDGDWVSENWTLDGGTTWVAPAGGEAMRVDSGIVTISTDLTVLDPDKSLSVARDSAGGTVVIAPTGTLAVGEVTVAGGGTLNVNGSLIADSLDVTGGVLGLGGGATIVSPLAQDDLAVVTMTVDGTLNAGGGVALVGDEFNDLGTTNISLADGSVFNWTFGSGDNYVDIFGEVIFEGGVTIQLVDGGGSSAGGDVALFRAFEAIIADLSQVTVLSPSGENWTWATNGGDPVLTFDGEFLFLEGLVTGGGGDPHPGDVNNDLSVDEADLAIFEAQFGGAPGVDSADFDGDGDVDLDDLAVMRANWGWSGAGAVPAGISEIPEPATISLMIVGGLGLITRRRAAGS